MDEPMDVDSSAHSASVMDISYTSSNVDLSIVKTEQSAENYVIFVSENSFNDKMIIKPEIINKLNLCRIQSRSSLARPRKSKHGPIILILSLTVLFISIVTYRLFNINCCERFDMESLRHDLMTKLYGQAAAAQDIVKALDAKESRKIIIFYGGTGVGKTFTKSLMLENILNYENIYHYTMPSFLQTFSSEFMLGLLFCKSFVLVVDDLTSNDTLNIKVPIKELLVKTESLAKNITIILIYNCVVVNENFTRKCDENFSLEIKQRLEDLDATKYFIRFKSLTEEHLRNCIEDELADKKISVNSIERIAKHFNVTLDGCKGVHQKLQYMKIL